MPSLVFDKGYKEYDINGDKDAVIRVYTSDWNIIKRISELKGRIAEKVKSLESLAGENDFNSIMDKLNGAERDVRAEIDAAFGLPVSDAAFGALNCLSFANGQPIALNFLEAIGREIEKDLSAEAEKANEKVAQYKESVKGYK